MGDALRVGIVGCGKIAERNHIPGFNGVEGTDVVALCDIVPEKAKALQAELAPAADLYDDAETMYREAGLDAVAVCTPNSLHCPQTIAAFDAGLHVLCEKPMAGSLPEATRMIEAGNKAGKVLQINQSLRYSALYVTIVDLVHSGAIGEVIHIRCLRAGGSTPDKGWSPGATWFVSSKFQGGLVLDIAIHMADLMKWAVGDAEKVAAFVDTRLDHIDVPDNVNALYRFKSGATGMLELSWTIPSGGGLLEIYGTGGTIRNGFGEESIELIQTGDGEPKKTNPPLEQGVKNSQQCFLEAIKGIAPSPTSGEMGRDALALCDAVAKSGETGRFEPIQHFG